jgi:two-component system sensor histidine kinase CssS
MSEKSKAQDLKVAHDILLKNNDFDQHNRSNEFANLKESRHFTVDLSDSDNPIIKEANKKPGFLNDPPKGPARMNDIDSIEIKTWMSSFINNQKLDEKQFSATRKNTRFIFIISTMPSDSTGKSYLISYMPIINDNGILYTIMIIGVVFIAIGFLTAKVVANYISKPLKELEDYTIRIAQKNWKEPLQVKSEDEIGRLVDSMNHMQKELKHADEEEKMFLQSISHDLKTPVMVIMSHADAIIDGVYIESVEKTAEIIRNEAMSLEKKIKQLLYLNTLDYVLTNNSESTSINLYDLLMHIISRFEVVNSKIEWDLSMDKICINGNVDKIQVSIENILENGLRYAHEKISVTLKEEDGYAVLDLYNDGPNIKAENVDRIFDNFYKDKTGNFGLGLAISKKIIDFYRGSIKAVNRENGVSFIIKFPI